MVAYDTSYTTYFMQPDVHRYINSLWIAIGILWLVSSLWTKPSTRVQASGSRLLQILLAVPGFFLVFGSFHPAILNLRLLPESPGIAYAGLVLTALGIAFAAWARLVLGRNWSGIVTTKQDHALVRRGPYAIVRHPIYSGGLLALFGTALSRDSLAGMAGLAVVFIAWWTKLRIEERFMFEHFGSEYTKYRQEVKALIPFVL